MPAGFNRKSHAPSKHHQTGLQTLTECDLKNILDKQEFQEQLNNQPIQQPQETSAKIQKRYNILARKQLRRMRLDPMKIISGEVMTKPVTNK